MEYYIIYGIWRNNRKEGRLTFYYTVPYHIWYMRARVRFMTTNIKCLKEDTFAHITFFFIRPDSLFCFC